eukprot:708435_1
MSNAVTNAPTHSAGAGCAFKSLGARDCYAKTLEQFDESVHSEELIESYKKSDQIVRLCYGKMAMGAPLLLSVFPDRREQHKLDRTFTELIPQEMEDIILVFLSNSKWKQNPICLSFDAKVQYHALHSFRIRNTRLIYHEFGCQIKDKECPEHPLMPDGLLQVPLVSKPLRKSDIDDRVEFTRIVRHLSDETCHDLGKYEPLRALQSLLSNKVHVYDTEKDRLKTINPSQPKWERVNWSDPFQAKMNTLILKYPTKRESASRWMVEHILQKNVYKAWKKEKKKQIDEFIERRKVSIVRNLKVLHDTPDLENVEFMNE